MTWWRFFGSCIGALTIATQAAEVLIFEDTFQTFNLSLWKHELTLSGGGNWEFEGYTNNRTTSFVRNGTLYVVPTLLEDVIGSANLQNGFTLDISGMDPAGYCTSNFEYGCLRTSGGGGNILNPIQSVRLRTAETFAFRYGRVEFVAKLPKGDWMWPALWLLPANQAYGNWPASGEIDIVESRGNARGYAAGGVEQFSSTLHWGPYAAADAYTLTHNAYTIPTGDLSDAFHTYGMIWMPTYIMTYIDSVDNVVLNVSTSNSSFWQRGPWNHDTVANPWEGQPNNAPFDQRFYLIIDLAIGGTNGYFPDGVGGKPWSDSDPHAVNAFYSAKDAWYSTWPQPGGTGSPFMIDSVRVWQDPTVPNADYAYRLML